MENRETKVLGNIAIAEYLGIKVIEGKGSDGGVYYYYNNAEWQDYEALPDYDTWEYLMPVVEKINISDFVTIFSDKCTIHSLTSEFETIVVEGDDLSLIECVFNAVLIYIKL